jgi:hypothetical protein
LTSMLASMGVRDSYAGMTDLPKGVTD